MAPRAGSFPTPWSAPRSERSTVPSLPGVQTCRRSSRSASDGPRSVAATFPDERWRGHSTARPPQLPIRVPRPTQLDPERAARLLEPGEHATIPLHVVATDIERAEVVVLSRGPALGALLEHGFPRHLATGRHRRPCFGRRRAYWRTCRCSRPTRWERWRFARGCRSRWWTGDPAVPDLLRGLPGRDARAAQAGGRLVACRTWRPRRGGAP